MFDCFEWLHKNTNYEIQKRKDELIKKCPGAVFDINEPKFVWIEAVTRPTTSAMKNIFLLVYKFNAVMQECISKCKNHTLLKIETITELNCFDASGRLTPIGKEKYWKELMRKLQALIPRDQPPVPSLQSTSASNSSAQDSRHPPKKWDDH